MLRKLYPDILRVSASGWIYVPYLYKDHGRPMEKTIKREVGEGALQLQVHLHIIENF